MKCNAQHHWYLNSHCILMKMNTENYALWQKLLVFCCSCHPKCVQRWQFSFDQPISSFCAKTTYFFFIFQTFSKLLENEGIETLFRGFPLVHQWTLSSLVCCYLSVFSCVFVCFVSVCLCLFLFALGIDFALNYFMGYASVLCFVVFLEKFIVYIYSLHINL